MSQTTGPSSDQERYSRRLSDKIQAAFEHACEEGELAVAADLLNTLEMVLLRVPPKPDRREAVVAPLMAFHERLWHLRIKEGVLAPLGHSAASDPATPEPVEPVAEAPGHVEPIQSEAAGG